MPLALFERATAGWIFLGIGAAASLATALLLARWLDLRGRKFTLLIMLFAANGLSLREGNTTHIVGLLLVASLILICAGRPFLAGVLVGFCALVKLSLMLFCAYYVFQRRSRIAAGAALAIAVLVLLSLLIFGADINIGWYDKCVAPYLRGVVGAFNVQSIDAFLLRLGTGETLLWNWEPVEVSLAHRIGRSLIVGSMLAAVLFLMWRVNRRKRPSAATDMGAAALEFVLVLNLALVASPLSWVHYYLLLLVPAGLLMGGRLLTNDDRSARWLIYGGLMLASMPVAIPDLGEGPLGSLAARSAVSVWLFGGLSMLGGLMRAAWLDWSRKRS